MSGSNENQKRTYISLPISGRPMSAVRANIERVSKTLKSVGLIPVSPLSDEINPDPKADYATFMGNDIRALLNCGAIYMVRGWRDSRGCQLEYKAARIYGLDILVENSVNKQEYVQNERQNDR